MALLARARSAFPRALRQFFCALLCFENAEHKTDGLITVWFQEFVIFASNGSIDLIFFQRGVVSQALETNPVPRAPSFGGAIGGWGRRPEQRFCWLYKERRARGVGPGLIAQEAKNSVFFFHGLEAAALGSLVYLGLSASRLTSPAGGKQEP